MNKLNLFRFVLILALLAVGYSALLLASGGPSINGIGASACCLEGYQCPEGQLCCNYEELGAEPCDSAFNKPHYCRDSCAQQTEN